MLHNENNQLMILLDYQTDDDGLFADKNLVDEDGRYGGKYHHQSSSVCSNL